MADRPPIIRVRRVGSSEVVAEAEALRCDHDHWHSPAFDLPSGSYTWSMVNRSTETPETPV